MNFNLMTPQAFVNSYGIKAAKGALAHVSFDPDHYYCHSHYSGFITLQEIFSDHPNIEDGNWVKLSELKTYVQEIEGLLQ